MEKSLLIGAVVQKINCDDNNYLIIDKVIVYGGASSSTVFLAVNEEGIVVEIYWDKIKKVVSFPDQSPKASEFINSSKKQE